MANPISCEEIVYRAITKKGWIDPVTLQLNANAFVLQTKDKDDGLSVYLKSAVHDLGAKLLEQFKCSFGADTLHVGRVRTLDLDVLNDAAGPDPAHGFISGLPSPDDNPELAERLASQLRDMSRSLDRTKRERK